MILTTRLPSNVSAIGSSSGGPRSIPWDKYGVLLMALTVTVCAIIWAFFVERVQFFDEVGLFNPAYMYLHYGTVTYPAHWQFHSMTIHPPLHYWILGLLMKTGLSLYYAEAVPPLLLMLLGVFLIFRSLFPDAAKFGFLFALCVPFMSEYFHASSRPDAHRALALFVGLLALETGRLQQWSAGRLFFGSFLLTYSSALHYPGFVGFLGVAVYVIWLLKERGWCDVRKPLMALLLGGLLVGLPYLGLFVIPHWSEIVAVLRSTNPMSGGVATKVETHLRMYKSVSQQLQYWPARILFYPLALGIPLIVPALGGLVAFRPTRALALAGLPYPVFLLLFVSHKIYWAMYLLPEFMLYGAALSIVVISAIAYLGRKVLPRYEWLAATIAAFILTGGLLFSSPPLRQAELSLRARAHEAEIARAATRLMLGPNALVGTRGTVMFYAGGGVHYFDVGDVLRDGPNPFDIRAYFEPFDAVIEHPAFSNVTMNSAHQSLISWYVDGVLKLRGFYMSNLSDTLPHLVLSTKALTHVQGFGILPTKQVAHFQEDAGGEYIFVSAVCPIGADFGLPFSVFRNTYLLPASTDQSPDRQVVTLIGRAADYLAERAKTASHCAIRDEVRLRIELIDPGRLLDTLRDDQPIRFYQSRDDALAGRFGPQHSYSSPVRGGLSERKAGKCFLPTTKNPAIECPAYVSGFQRKWTLHILKASIFLPWPKARSCSEIGPRVRAAQDLRLVVDQPRVTSLLCDKALLVGFADHQIQPALAKQTQKRIAL